MSSNFSTRNSTILYFLFILFWTLPHIKYSIKLFINCSSLICWPILNLNNIWFLCDTVFLFLISIWNQLSAEAKPANQFGSNILLNYDSILRPDAILIFGKAFFNSGDKPLLIELLIKSNLLKPSFVKCSLFLIILNASLNNL